MTPLIQVRNLKTHFKVKKGYVKAVDNVSFEIYPKETLGLVGESGCGKSTLGRSLLRLIEPTSGEVLFNDLDILKLPARPLKSWRKDAQIIFQDPYASLNPRMTAEDILREPFDIHGIPATQEMIHHLFAQVALNPNLLRRFPHEFSGGQRQRIGIARALALSPRFIVCDEPLSALDVSIQAQIVNLLRDLQRDLSLSYLFISHDLRMVKYISDRVAVMYLGHIVELTTSEELYAHPLHPYTQALLSAIPIPDPVLERKRTRVFLSGDAPSPLNPPKGCLFCTRCPKSMPICYENRPELKIIQPGHQIACHLY